MREIRLGSRSLWRFLCVCGVVLSVGLSSASSEDRCCGFSATQPVQWETTVAALHLAPQKVDPSCEWRTAYENSTLMFGDDEHVYVAMHFVCEVPFHDAAYGTDDVSEFVVGSALPARHFTMREDPPVRLGQLGLSLLPSGDLALAAGSRVVLLSTKLEALRERRFSDPASARDWQIVFPTRGDSGIAALFRSSEAELHWFSLSSLADMGYESGLSTRGTFVVNERTLYYVPWEAGEGRAAGVRNEVHSKPMLKPDRGLLCDLCDGVPEAFTSDGHLIVTTLDNDYLLVSEEGKLFQRGKIEGGNQDGEIEEAHAAQSSPRAAFVYRHTRARSIQSTIDVVDFVKNRRIFRVSIEQRPLESDVSSTFPPLRVALSPSGHKLAILYGSRVAVFSVDK